MVRLLGNGRYVLGKQLGVGGMGIVYEAEDLARTERVAIKLMHAEHLADGVIAEHMDRELIAGQAVHHRNVVAVLDGGREAGRPYVVMELAVGRTLAVAAGEDKPTVRRAVDIVDQILAGVSAIHQAGWLHGDLKTDNVLVTRDEDGGDRVRIIDLGLAHPRVAAPSAPDGVIAGTPDFLSPEVAVGGAKTVASDLYAVGVILYDLLTGTTPFGGGSLDEILRRQVDTDVMPPSLRRPELKISLALERVVLRALEKHPDRRYADAAAFRADLRAAMQGTSPNAVVSAREFSTSAPTMDWTRPELPPRRVFACGTQPPGLASPSREPHVIVEAALDAARSHVAEHRLLRARDELDAALGLIDDEPAAAAGAWRLQLALAAVCDGLRDVRRARSLARAALDGAARAGSEIGRRRAKALIERFAGHPQARA